MGKVREWWKERQAEKSAAGTPAPGGTSNSEAPKGPGSSGSTTPTLDLADKDPYAIPADAAAKGPKVHGVCEEYTTPDPVYGEIAFSPSEHAGSTPDTDAKRKARDKDRAPDTGRPTKNAKGEAINDPTVNATGVDPEEWALQQYRQCRYAVATYELNDLFGPVYETLRTLVNDQCRTPADDARFTPLKKEVLEQGKTSVHRIDKALGILDKRHKAHQHEVKFERDLIVFVRDDIKAMATGVLTWTLPKSLLPPGEKKPKAPTKKPKAKDDKPAATP